MHPWGNSSKVYVISSRNGHEVSSLHISFEYFRHVLDEIEYLPAERQVLSKERFLIDGTLK